MLLKLRGGLDSIFVTILLGLLIGAFAIWGIGPNMLSSANQSIATVGETEVSTNRYYAQVQNQAQQLQARFGGQMSTADIINTFRLDENILQQMIVTAAVGEHMSNLGLRAGNDLIRKELQNYEGFILPDGTISKEMIQQALDANNMTRSEFMDEVRRSVTMEQLLGSFTAEDPVTRDFAETLYGWQAERRFASMIHIQASDMTVDEPTDEDVAAYYELSKAAFMAPETRSYQYILVTPAMFAGDVVVTEEDLKSLYDNRISEYVTPERREILQASFNDKAAADAFLVALEAGGDFLEAATSVTSFTEEEMQLGSFTQNDLARDFNDETAAAIFAADEGSTTGALAAFSGFNVFKVEAVTAGEEKAFADVRADLEKEFRAEEAINLMYDYLPDLEDALADDPALTAVAEKLGIELATVTSINRQGQLADGTQAATQEAEARILASAFETEMDIEAEMTDLDSRDSEKGVFLVEVTGITESAERPLEDVRTNVVDAWKAEERTAKAGKVAEEVRARLALGESAEDITAELGGTSFDAKNVVRTGGENTSLSPTIRSLIFDLKEGETGSERASDSNGYIALRVNEIIPGDPAANTGAVDKLLAEISSGYTDEILAQYQNYLLQEYRPVVNRTIQQQLFKPAGE